MEKDFEEVKKQMISQFLAYVTENEITDTEEQSKLMRAVFDSLSDKFRKEKVFREVTAANAVVEVIDEKSGALFRRYLELSYVENEHGLRLVGEAMDGSDATIVYLSENALLKMKDLQGGGADKSPCEGH